MGQKRARELIGPSLWPVSEKLRSTFCHLMPQSPVSGESVESIAALRYVLGQSSTTTNSAFSDSVVSRCFPSTVS